MIENKVIRTNGTDAINGSKSRKPSVYALCSKGAFGFLSSITTKSRYC